MTIRHWLESASVPKHITAGGDLAFYPEGNRTTLEGSGNWKEAVYWVSDVKFDGVNVDDHQAAVRFWFTAPIYISRYRLGIARTSGIDEGVDPIPDAYPFDPDPYHIYAQLDIDKGISEGLDFGVNGGDQEYFIEDNVGPKMTSAPPSAPRLMGDRIARVRPFYEFLDPGRMVRTQHPA